MTRSGNSPLVPLVDIQVHASTPSGAESSIRFPSTGDAAVNASQSASTQLTSSDKLTALPTSASSPGYFRSPASTSRPVRRSFDAGSSSASSHGSTPPASPKLYGMSPSATATARKPRQSEESAGKDSASRPRVSFDSDRHSMISPQQTHPSITARLGISSDPVLPIGGSASASSSPPPAASRSPRFHRKSLSRPRSEDSQPASAPASRATSPLRFLPTLLHRIQSREEPFVPIDPFSFPWNFHRRHESHDDEASTHDAWACLPLPICISRSKSEDSPLERGITLTYAYATDVVPRQIYLHMLLRLPSLYWARVCHIFEDAEVTKPEMQRMIDAACARARPPPNMPTRDVAAATVAVGAVASAPTQTTAHHGHPDGRGHEREPTSHQISRLLPFPEEWKPPAVSPAMARFKRSWEAFVDSVMREWKTLNVLSALLLSAILTMFQIEDAAKDPVTRMAALLSLVCALMSLCYGALFIIRFGTMRSMYKAFRWANEAQKSRTSILWNCWVLLAMPAVWLAWSMLFFVVAILSFVWRTGSASDPAVRPQLPLREALAARALVSALFMLGLVYLALIINTFKSYGSWDAMPAKIGTPSTEEAGAGGVRAREGGETERGRARGEPARGRTANRAHGDIHAEAAVGLGLIVASGERRGQDGRTARGVREEMDLEKGDFLPGVVALPLSHTSTSFH